MTAGPPAGPESSKAISSVSVVAIGIGSHEARFAPRPRTRPSKRRQIVRLGATRAPRGAVQAPGSGRSRRLPALARRALRGRGRRAPPPRRRRRGADRGRRAGRPARAGDPRALPDPGNDLRVGASIGVALYGAGGAGAAVLLPPPRTAPFTARRPPGPPYRFSAGGMDAEVRARVALVSDLRAGLDAGQLF